MEGWNKNTGEFESTSEDKKELPEGKSMITKEGKKVLLLENNMVFDPASGIFLENIKIEDLKEII